jgi:hypothetical protein
VFKKSGVKVHIGFGSEEEGWIVEQKIASVKVTDANDDNVISVFLDEDVFGAHGTK